MIIENKNKKKKQRWCVSGGYKKKVDRLSNESKTSEIAN